MVIPGFSRYDITEDGVVTCIATGKTLKTHTVTVKGFYKYRRVNLTSDDGVVRVHSISRLLALTYLVKPCTTARTRAKDNDHTNTRLSNIEWSQPTDDAKRLWEAGKIVREPRKSKSVDESSCEMILEAMGQYDVPVTMVTLSYDLQVPYSTVRYSIKSLIDSGKVVKVTGGYEVIK